MRIPLSYRSTSRPSGVSAFPLGCEIACLFNRHFTEALISFWIYPFLVIWGFVKQYLPTKENALPTRPILFSQSGLVKPGEMCLVLGCPGAGCTTFLKSIANERGDYATVSGGIRYAGIDAGEMAKLYKGEVLYNQEGVLCTTEMAPFYLLLGPR